ncbi:hypothetical protein P692DRAFT_20829713 [Suillus brevipes Sb2]|nr:hypothetical protein P692DRAFT_20829713 [Suillus brevipes Sb2]
MQPPQLQLIDVVLLTGPVQSISHQAWPHVIARLAVVNWFDVPPLVECPIILSLAYRKGISFTSWFAWVHLSDARLNVAQLGSRETRRVCKVVSCRAS